MADVTLLVGWFANRWVTAALGRPTRRRWSLSLLLPSCRANCATYPRRLLRWPRSADAAAALLVPYFIVPGRRGHFS